MIKSSIFAVLIGSLVAHAETKSTITMIHMNLPGVFNLSGDQKGKGSQDLLETKFFDAYKHKYDRKSVEATSPERIVALLQDKNVNYCFSYSGNTYFPPDTLFSHPIGLTLNFGLLFRKGDQAKFKVVDNMVSLTDILDKRTLRGIRTALPADLEALVTKHEQKDAIHVVPDISAQIAILNSNRADYGLNYYALVSQIAPAELAKLDFLPIKELEANKVVRVAFTCSPTSIQKQVIADINTFITKSVFPDKRWFDTFFKSHNSDLENFLRKEMDKVIASTTSVK